ncbi:hypothetical protein, conserved [Eimeria necatrix]|uniref:Fe2OG dioxygenase domain-containing protein n=1 Tax=Eimeria necatrix TaxID=51315 RepID=U6MYS4_9EIME|nr:hypothetical protein, conserved [Eimeria necatrix]CDJ68193.1 hypothetical protein, conserved [Eimeria necatrix]
MKGRWRKDKRPAAEKPNGAGSFAGGSAGQQAPNNILAGFRFSGTVDKAAEQQRECYENAHASLVRSQFAMCDGETHDDFMKALTGGSIYIPAFFNASESEAIFNALMKELSDYANEQQPPQAAASEEAAAAAASGPAAAASGPAAAASGPAAAANGPAAAASGPAAAANGPAAAANGPAAAANGPAAAANGPAAAANGPEAALSGAGVCRWSRHLKHENPEGFPTFQKVVQRISSYFDLEIFATRMNIYPDGSHWKPHHHDSHAYSSERNQAEDFTVGASFGAQRALEFAHVKSGLKFRFPQTSGSIFSFNSFVNKSFTHGVPAEPAASVGPRISIIVWGRRRSLNKLNACASELKQ